MKLITGFSILILMTLTACLSSKEIVYYQIKVESEGQVRDDMMMVPAYQDNDNQCGELLINGDTLYVDNNKDTNTVFLTFQYSNLKNRDGMFFSTYTFKDHYFSKHENLEVESLFQESLVLFEINSKDIKVLDASLKKVQENDSLIVYERITNVNNQSVKEMYSVKKIIVNHIKYEKQTFPCD